MSTPLKDLRLGVAELTDLALATTAKAFGSDKQTVARDVLDEWARKKHLEHTLYARGLVANGLQTELPGFSTGDNGLGERRGK